MADINLRKIILSWAGEPDTGTPPLETTVDLGTTLYLNTGDLKEFRDKIQSAFRLVGDGPPGVALEVDDHPPTNAESLPTPKIKPLKDWPPGTVVRLEGADNHVLVCETPEFAVRIICADLSIMSARIYDEDHPAEFIATFEGMEFPF